MRFTESFRLRMPQGFEQYDIDDHNYNYQSIDEALEQTKSAVDKLGDTVAAIEMCACEPPEPPPKNYFIGTYVGDGDDGVREIRIGFPPNFVSICRDRIGVTDSSVSTPMSGAVLNVNRMPYGFGVSHSSDAFSNNQNNIEYRFIAFK